MDPQEHEAESELNPQVLFAWKAPLRAYKKRGKNVLRFYVALALLLSLIVIFFSDKVLLIPIWSVLFLFYTLTITPPPEVENRITKFGIESAGITMRWDGLSHFYFVKRFDFDVLTVVTHAPYHFHAYFVIPDEDIKTRVKFILSEHLVYLNQPPRTITDTIITWLSNLLPDDGEEEKTTEEPQTAAFSQTPAPTSL